MKRISALLILTSLTLLTCALAKSHRPTVIHLRPGRNALEFVGQFNNAGTDSQQFGYLSTIEGLDPIFSSLVTQDETTALFTFVTNATTDRVISSGPFRITNRTGITTLYVNTAPASFADPASFSQGTPIQVSNYRQQVILNTLTNAFVTVHMNDITQSEEFMLNGKLYQLGCSGESFRTTYSGQPNAPGSTPSGWFAGYAVGTKSAESEEEEEHNKAARP